MLYHILVLKQAHADSSLKNRNYADVNCGIEYSSGLPSSSNRWKWTC